MFSDARIVESWMRNAAPWTAAVREQRIETRRLATDRAVIDAVTACGPRRVLDLGCGEGWLARVLAAAGIEVTGIDVVPQLIERATLAGAGDFRVLSYEEIAAGKLATRVDVAVANFALLGCECVQGLLTALPGLLSPGGRVIVQTLHPVSACGEAAYQDGWRAGSWAGFSDEFADPAPWYFRTVSSWIELFHRSGMRLRSLREPLHPRTLKPCSILFIAEAV